MVIHLNALVSWRQSANQSCKHNFTYHKICYSSGRITSVLLNRCPERLSNCSSVNSISCHYKLVKMCSRVGGKLYYFGVQFWHITLCYSTAILSAKHGVKSRRVICREGKFREGKWREVKYREVIFPTTIRNITPLELEMFYNSVRVLRVI